MTSPGLIDLSASRMMPLTKLADDLLQAEADADADRAGEHREHREVDADRAQHDDDRDRHHADADQLAEQHLDRRRQPADVLDAAVEEVAGRGRGPQRHRQQHRGLEHQQRRDPQAADQDGARVERRHRVVEQAEDAQRRDASRPSPTPGG